MLAAPAARSVPGWSRPAHEVHQAPRSGVAAHRRFPDDAGAVQRHQDVDATAGGSSAGRTGAWHAYRWQSPMAGVVMALAVPWPVVPPARRADLVVGIVLLGLAWAVPTWRCGLTVDSAGVRCTGLLWSRRYGWDRLVGAELGWHNLEPRLLLELTDGEVVVVPGLRVPLHQAYRRDLWRESRMYAAAELIGTEVTQRAQASRP